jgi:glycosyltransferase involved in cell wall biosynthesis
VLLAFAQRAGSALSQLLVTTVRANESQKENLFIDAARRSQVPLVTLIERHAFDWSVISELAQTLERAQPDIVESHGYKSHALVWLARRRIKSAVATCPWLAFHHGYTTESLRVRLYNEFDRFTLPRADRVITFCRDFERQLCARGVGAERLTVLRNALDPTPPPSQATLAQLRAELGLAATDVILLAVGRLSSEKGHAELIAAFTQLLRSADRPNLRLLIVGDGIEAGRLKEQAGPLRNSVIFTGHRSSAWPYFGLADIFVLPSRSEGSPLALLEAMQARLPIVATCVGGVAETVQDEVSALLVPPRDPHALATALARLLDDTMLAGRLGAQGIEQVQCFTVDDYAAALLSIYRDLALRTGPPKARA